jgi:deazaflavin-dependent oxidoreductase (nitroreductase family)
MTSPRTRPGTTQQRSPRGLLRLAVRLPIWLYRLRLGWLLGERMLLLTHTGRRSGRPRQTVLEVLRADRTTGVYIVASGWGERADWYQNLMRRPEVRIAVGGRRMAARAERLPNHLAEQELQVYAQRHPAMFRRLAQLMLGQPLDPDSAATCRQLVLRVPLVKLTASVRRQAD